MGIWELINLSAEVVKQACGASFNFCHSAGEVVNEETRSQIGVFAYKLAENSAKYALHNLVPGGQAVAKIVGDTVRDCRLETKKVTKTVRDGGGNGIKSPENVLMVFMAKLMGNRKTK